MGGFRRVRKETALRGFELRTLRARGEKLTFCRFRAVEGEEDEDKIF